MAASLQIVQDCVGELVRLCLEGQSGEFRAALDESQVTHVLLEQGRIAWASSSGSRHTFTRVLMRQYSIPRTKIEKAIAGARESHTPFGEYLVAEGLLTQDSLRTALRHSIRLALADLTPETPFRFMKRNQASGRYYSATFRIEEFINPDSLEFTSDFERKSVPMAEFDLSPLASTQGYVVSALVDSSSGMLMAHHGSSPFSLELAAAGNTEVVRAKMRTMQNIAIQEVIEDILITLETQYHLIRPLASHPHVFLYLVLDKDRANLAMARHALRDFESQQTF